MTSRQPDQTAKTSSIGNDPRFWAALPLLFCALTITSILIGASVPVTIALSAAGAIICAAVFYAGAKRPQQQVLPATEPDCAISLSRNEYRKRQDQYRQTIEATSAVTSAIMHDTNRRLKAIGSSIETVAAQFDGSPALKQKLHAAQESATRVSTALARLASFIGQKEWQPQRISSKEHISAAADLIRKSLLSETVYLETTTGDNLWPLEVDADQLQTALINLAVNAREAMPRGGAIRIEAHNATISDYDLNLHGDFVRITVSDTGSGIAKEDIAKVFQPFFTTRETRNGIGVGLIQVKMLALRANGDVTIESTLGEGTSVVLYLPKAGDSSEVSTITERRAPSHAAILIAEGGKDLAAELETMVSDLGHTVRTATDSAAALTAIRVDPPEVVMTDISMSGTVEGVPLCRQLRHRHPGMPIILITDNPRIAADSPDFSVLLKPVTSEKLQTVLQRLLPEQKEAQRV